MTTDLPRWIDTHAHLDDPALAGDLRSVLDRARAAGVAQVVAIGTTASESASVVAIAQSHLGVFAAVGIHPNQAAEAAEGDWERLVTLAGSPGVVAIGETGLDRYRDRTPFALQREMFDRHLDLARERDLPVVIHCRQSEREIIDQLSTRGGPVRGVLHSFTGTWDDARAFLDLGLDLSFAGMVTFENKALEALRDVAVRVPIGRLLVETDSPYLSPHPHRGQTNEPCRVQLTGEKIARIRDLSPAEFAAATSANARRLFALPETVTL